MSIMSRQWLHDELLDLPASLDVGKYLDMVVANGTHTPYEGHMEINVSMGKSTLYKPFDVMVPISVAA